MPPTPPTPPKRLTPAPYFPPGFRFTSLSEACTLELLPPPPPPPPSPSPPLHLPPFPTTYFAGFLPRDWCIGFVPHGGFLTSLLVSAGHEFLRHLPTSCHGETLSPEFTDTVSRQIHPIRVQVEFLRRARAGAACIVRVQGRKLGRGYSVLAASLYQLPDTNDTSGATSTPPQHHECCTGHLTFTCLPTTEPLTNPTIPLPHSPSYPIPPLSTCPPYPVPPKKLQWSPATSKLTYHCPSTAPPLGVFNQWVRWADYPTRRVGFHPRDLGYICDMYMSPAEEMYVEKFGKGKGGRWYPTLGYEVEVKRVPQGEEGWEWLFVRVEVGTGGVRGGRADIKVEVWGKEEGEGEEKGGSWEMCLVARAGQVCLMVGAERNMRGRAGSKI